MTPPPSATADYDASYEYAPEDIHAMMAEVTAQQGNAFWRAVRALCLCVFGVIILVSVLAYNPFDPTSDTAGIGVGRHPFGTGQSCKYLDANFGLGRPVNWRAYIFVWYSQSHGTSETQVSADEMETFGYWVGRDSFRHHDPIGFPYPAELAYGERPRGVDRRYLASNAKRLA
jgi:hypothetical protein